MKNGVKIFSIFSLLFFLSFFLYFGLNIKTEFTKFYLKNEKNFVELKLRVLSTYLISSDLQTNYFSERMHELLNTSQSLEAFSIQDKSGTPLYVITKKRSILYNGATDDNKNIPHISDSLNPILYNVFKAPISLNADNLSYIRAVYKSIQIKDIYPFIKNAFFIVITFIAITFIYLLYLLTAREERVSSLTSNFSSKKASGKNTSNKTGDY